VEIALMRAFQEQIAQRARFVLMASNDADEALNQLEALAQRGVTERAETAEWQRRFWYSIQSVVVSAGNISKALWGQGKHAPTLVERRKPLRDSINVDDSSPLKPLRLRNHFEHFDERIDEWWTRSPNHNYVDRIIGPSDRVPALNVADIEVFRNFNHETGSLTFWGEHFDLTAIVREVGRILPLVDAELANLRW
jgi:hypothetical protein